MRIPAPATAQLSGAAAAADIRFGLQIPSARGGSPSGGGLFEHLAIVCRVAERCGFDSLWAMDHVIRSGRSALDPMPEAYTLLGAIAARTARARLGTLVAPVTFRNPALLVKMATTLDIISGGRAVLGVGAGWDADEHRRYGLPFPPVGERMRRLEDLLRIARAMLAEEAPAHRGHHHSIDGAVNSPRPLHGSIPILVGGNGERHTLRLTALYADICNISVGDPGQIRHKLAVLERHCESVGRDPGAITKTRAAGLVIAPRAEQATRAAEAMRAAIGMDRERFARYAIVGTPDRVCESVQASFDAGLDGLMFNIPDEPGTEAVELAGETLRAAFG